MALSQGQIRAVDPVLASMVVGALQGDDAFVARQAMPVIQVGGKGATGQIYVEDNSVYLGDPAVGLLRAPGAEFATIQNDGPSTASYRCRARGAQAPPLPKEFIRRSDYPIDLKARDAARLARSLLIQEDVDAANLFFGAASGWATSTVAALGGGGLQWDVIGATPITDLDIVRNLVRASGHGVDPNTLILAYDAMVSLRRNAEVRALFTSGTGTALGVAVASGERLMTASAVIAVLKEILEIETVLIGKARRRTGIPPATTEADIWTDAAWMGSIDNASAAIVGGSNVRVQATAAAMFLEESTEAGIEWEWRTQTWNAWTDEAYDMVELDANLGYRLSDLLT